MNIYADRRYLPTGIPHCPMLYPHWGLAANAKFSNLSSFTFERYLAEGIDFFDLTALADARAAVLPFQWEQIAPGAIRTRLDLELHDKDAETVERVASEGRRLAAELAAEAASTGNPLVVFLVHYDEATQVPFSNAWVFRSSLYASRRSAREFPLPFWIRDEVAASHNGEVPLRQKQAKPVVGFCGQVIARPAGDWKARWALKLAEMPFIATQVLQRGIAHLAYPEFRTRVRALALLSDSRAVQSNFIFRNDWFNGAFLNGVDLAVVHQSRAAYYDNLFGSDYIVCARGYGNCSVRFYETLCCGRIPVFVNTDCVLPFEKWIDWKEYCVWVEEEDLPHIADQIVEFHERLSSRQFRELQQACRRLWTEWLSPHGFFKNFYRHFQ